MDVLSLLAARAAGEEQLFPFALVCRDFRRAQLASKRPLRTPLSAISTGAQLEWAVAQGAPPLWGRVAAQMELACFTKEAVHLISLELQGYG